MIWPIIIVCIAYVITLAYLWEPGDRIAAIFFSWVPAFGITALLTAALWGCLYPFTGPVHHVHTSSLVNLQDNASTDGHYFLGIGSTNGDLAVSYYTSANNYASPHTVNNADYNIRIYQDLAPNATPYVTRTEADPHFWTGSLFNGANTPDRYDFHVPAGTIKQNFSLDAQ